MKLIRYPYTIFETPQHISDSDILVDHIGGWDSLEQNMLLGKLNQYAVEHNKTYYITYHQIIENSILQKYSAVKIVFDAKLQQRMNFEYFKNYNIHPELAFKNFVCSFNGSPHVSRKLLVAILKRLGYFDPEYCSKNFIHSTDILSGHIQDYVGDNCSFYNKFFIADYSEDFFQTVNSFGHVRFAHSKNIYNLELKLTESFLHIVSETLATSYVPFVTEKFLYSIVTRGLFLCYAQPGWHAHVETYYGFKRYTKLFDYKFDSIQNPVERLVELMTMISKFSVLSTDDWRDLYLIEQDTIEYNYDHYFSGDYIKCLEQYE